ncbi:uncharacterized protein LOC112456449, partial [Temnothorax curvispinosus]|uniref:Uncharacterized protein LOC112456449 n=1 Tax=Temnothorax curvispinosus TaxID=300111 RepID=A0A6J1PXV0_9HYME
MAGSNIPFTQINLHHSKCASAVLARCAAVMHTKHLFLIQEPWLVKGHIKGLGGCGKLFKADNAERPRACIVAKGIDACLLPQFSDGDLVARNYPPQRNMIEIVAYAKKKGLELLLGCDANSHHLVWGSSNINPRGESLLDFIISTNLQILNRGKEPTFLDSRRQEVIDITLGTRGVVDLVAGWRVSNEPSGSDHRQIRFDLVNLQKDEQWGRNSRKTNWEGFKTDLVSRLKNTPTRFHTKEDLEIAASFVSDAIRESFELNCPLRPRNASAGASWWNEELSGLRTG